MRNIRIVSNKHMDLSILSSMVKSNSSMVMKVRWFDIFLDRNTSMLDDQLLAFQENHPLATMITQENE